MNWMQSLLPEKGLFKEDAQGQDRNPSCGSEHTFGLILFFFFFFLAIYENLGLSHRRRLTNLNLENELESPSVAIPMFLLTFPCQPTALIFVLFPCQLILFPFHTSCLLVNTKCFCPKCFCVVPAWSSSTVHDICNAFPCQPNNLFSEIHNIKTFPVNSLANILLLDR